MPMQWVDDQYVVLAGDVTLDWTSRGYNLETLRWETASGGNLGRSRMSKFVLRAANVKITNTGGNGRRGIVSQIYVVGDPVSTDRRIRLIAGIGVQGPDEYTSWVGGFPLCAGFVWRVNKGGLIAGDIVTCQLGYE